MKLNKADIAVLSGGLMYIFGLCVAAHYLPAGKTAAPQTANAASLAVPAQR